jgi:glycosyltransferase involved in cell wall biosynthesis
MTLQTPDKSQIDEAINRAMSLSAEEISALTYEDALALWRNLIFVAEKLELDSEPAKFRAEIVRRADEIFYVIADFETKNPELQKRSEKPLNVFAINPIFKFTWTNFLLARDKGYTPYFLSKRTGGRCVFFFVDENDPLPVKEILDGAEFIRKHSPSQEDYINYIKENIDEIDIFVLDDFASNFFGLSQFYKTLRPDGKVLFTTDINCYYYKTKADEGIFKWLEKFLNAPDVYTAASHSGCDIINTDPRFPKPVFFNSNAYLPDKSQTGETSTAEDKENIIMTAGRLGTFQKSNMPLIRAFVMLAPYFPDWKLYLCGSYEESDKRRLFNEAFKKLPYAADTISRIIFTGSLSKSELFGFYKKAKLFVLTSVWEGGTPNVFSEALAHGCYMVMPDRLDGAPEMTTADGFDIGTAYAANEYSKLTDDGTPYIDSFGEAVSLAKTLTEIMPLMTGSFFQNHIEKCKAYQARDFDYKKNSLKLFHLLFD